ncbi:MAG: Lrp/AsnC ligand binding domain-containing protein [Flavobacteriaceae bacterium]|nr:Lrp/AsnC ligand binding domain-containing protein [Flavobacteriaceae bacterium]
MNQFDFVDKEILRLLRKDARKAYSQIAQELKISNSLVHQRIRKMKSEGVIKNAEIVLDEEKVGYNTKSYIGIRLREAHFAEKVVKSLEGIEEVVECNYVSGNYAIFILVYGKNNDHLKHVLYEKIHHIEGVAGTDTFICFSTNFKRSVAV